MHQKPNTETVNKLKNDLKRLQQEYDHLNERYMDLSFRYSLLKDFSPQAATLNTMAAVDLIFYPNPIKIKAIEKGQGVEFSVSANEILLIKSEGRKKTIHFVKPKKPVEGGRERPLISVNSPFEELLKRLQRGQDHLLRVNKSTALNVLCYKPNGYGAFVLKSERPGFPQPWFKVETDEHFDSEMYGNIMHDFETLARYKNG